MLLVSLLLDPLCNHHTHPSYYKTLGSMILLTFKNFRNAVFREQIHLNKCVIGNEKIVSTVTDLLKKTIKTF